MKKHGFRERFRYRFDNIMAKGNISMIKILVFVTLIVVIALAAAIHLLTPPAERDFGGSFWDALASTVNAWMPYSEDGNLAYILLTALAAVTGLLFTSILIGIITAAVEEKVTSLREGNSVVLESGHTVVLGFTPGEYTLIEQLAATAQGEKMCIVVAGDLPKSETEACIRDNVELPENVRVICRCVDAGDIASLAVCSIPDCKTVVINQPNDIATVKATLAAYKLLSESGQSGVKIVSNVTSASFLLPADIAGKMNLINLSVNDVIARVIAHSCAETGLARAYTDLFDINGGRLQLLPFPALAGRTFGEAVRTMDGAVPIGLTDGARVLLNPPPEHVIAREDGVICWTEDGREIAFAEDAFRDAEAPADAAAPREEATVVIGYNAAFETLLRELPEQRNRVTAADVPPEHRDTLLAWADRRDDVSLSFFDGDPDDPETLRRLLADAQHAVVLSDEADDVDDADVHSILRYIKMADIKHREGLTFSVTVELRSEKNLQLTGSDSATDLIVAPHLVAMFLAQLAEHPELVRVFKELLSNEGSEIHLKPASLPGGREGVSCGELRAMLLRRRMILLGYVAEGRTVLNPPLNEIPDAMDQLVVISEK